MDSVDYHSALAALAWQVEAGVDAALLDAPLNRYDLETKPPAPKAAAAAATPALTPVIEAQVDPVAEAQAAARGAESLEALRAALAAYPHCDLAKGARNLVFSDGVPGARVMIVGEAPGRDEDREGQPFVGRAGQLLDKMLAAIDLSRTENVYITNVLPWRPPQNRDPQPEEIAMMKPFLSRHIALAKPEVLVVMGNISCRALLGKTGITRLHGEWDSAEGLPVLPMFHPAYLLRQPVMKRHAWADLLELKARLGASA
jgi:DNA polymerase